MIQINFTGTNAGVETDKKVQAAVNKFLAKVNKKEDSHKGELFIETKYKGTHDAHCKISGTGLKSPVVTADTTVGGAVNKGLGKVFDILANQKQTAKDKKEHANKKAKANTVEEDVQEEEFGL